MNPRAIELQERTRRFATAVIKFCQRLSHDAPTQNIVSQLLDSSGSTDSNYRATCRARSLQLLVSSDLASIEDARDLIQEADELTAIFVASRKTAKRRKAERERLQRLAGNTRRRVSK